MKIQREHPKSSRTNQKRKNNEKPVKKPVQLEHLNKKFLQLQMERTKKQNEQEDDSVIILYSSDSENDSNCESSFSVDNHRKRKKPRLEIPCIDLAITPGTSENCHTTSSHKSYDVTSTANKLNETILIDNDTSVMQVSPITSTVSYLKTTASNAIEFIPLTSNKQNETILIDNDTSVMEVSPITSTVSDLKTTASNAIEFIPLTSKKRKKRKPPKYKKRLCGTDIIEISSDEEEEPSLSVCPVLTDPPRLRPVVIDGSNVARAHGKPSNTYSCKGIKLCVDFFLKRGHTQVTAFVPLFRRHCKGKHIETTDQEILEELEKTQNLVFTPSRKLDGKTYSCYDDRFIVELAAANGGVILSNDNFKDLLGVSQDFKDTIEKRLLMFCFVGDRLMIPDDPLGFKGPTLQEFLTFPSQN